MSKSVITYPIKVGPYLKVYNTLFQSVRRLGDIPFNTLTHKRDKNQTGTRLIICLQFYDVS